MNFGITKCGQILDERIETCKKLSRKIRSFYCESCFVINELKSKTMDNKVKKNLLFAYVKHREWQIDNDLCLDVYEKEFILDVRKRLKYVIRFHAA